MASPTQSAFHCQPKPTSTPCSTSPTPCTSWASTSVITFVNTDFNHRRILRKACSACLAGLPDFRFATDTAGEQPPFPMAYRIRMTTLTAARTSSLSAYLSSAMVSLLNGNL